MQNAERKLLAAKLVFVMSSLCCCCLGKPKEIHPIRPLSPTDGEWIDSFLTATLRWSYPIDFTASPCGVHLKVSTKKDLSEPLVDTHLGDVKTEYRIALMPNTPYFWSVVPVVKNDQQWQEFPEYGFCCRFRTAAPSFDTTENDNIRYGNPRTGAHFQYRRVVEPGLQEPLSPWYEKKSFLPCAAPDYETIKDKLPLPVWEGHPEALEAYWFCWKTLMNVWHFAPDEPDHQAVSTICGVRSWGPWGSTMVWDTAFMMYFAKYGHQAYPFIQAFDNCYARQHENGFICRETDKNNREVYVIFPLNPPLFAWAEWDYYKVSGDAERLKRIFLPIVKHYEWWMRYQRRENGLYWTEGHNEADDSPRNTYMYYAVSATSYQAMAALYLEKIARTIGRDDMAGFFLKQHQELAELVNRYFWDEKHKIYNDLTEDWRFITELQPGELCKHCHIFWPLIAEIAPKARLEGMITELQNENMFLRRSGIASLSADSKGYNPLTGQYWRGAVWPPIQCMVQEGLRNNGRYDLARAVARRYFNAVLETFRQKHDITENLAPDSPQALGVGQCVGWGGIAPVSNFIEYILGLEIDAPANAITWNIALPEEHGLKNLFFRNFKVDLLCQKRNQVNEPRRITVSGKGKFQLNIRIDGKKTSTFSIEPGTQELILE